jgi:hypothetical protein
MAIDAIVILKKLKSSNSNNFKNAYFFDDD